MCICLEWSARIESMADEAFLVDVCPGSARLDAGRPCDAQISGKSPTCCGDLTLPMRRARSRRALPSSVICDLCDTQLSPLQPVYTCANGDATILHPTTYDVCEVCFVRYAVEGLGDEALATERQLLYEEEEIEAQEEVEAQESGGEAARGALEG